MMLPRRRFAAPLVLIVGCSSGGGLSPERTTPPVPPPISVAVDAAVEAPEVVALAADAAVDAVSPAPPRRGVDPPPKYPTCPGTIGPDNPCNPPRPQTIQVQIVESREDEGLVIVVDRGREDKIDKRWKVELRGTNGGVIPKFRGEIGRITARTTEFRFRESADRPMSEFRVYLVAPSPP